MLQFHADIDYKTSQRQKIYFHKFHAYAIFREIIISYRFI